MRSDGSWMKCGRIKTRKGSEETRKETDEQLEKEVLPFVYWSTYAVANHDERADTTKGEDDETVLICRQNYDGGKGRSSAV